MFARRGPYIQINATDLGTGQYFGFTKERFDLLCSDLTNFKVARAVAAPEGLVLDFSVKPDKFLSYRKLSKQH